MNYKVSIRTHDSNSDTRLNNYFIQKFKLIRRDEYNHLINIYFNNIYINL